VRERDRLADRHAEADEVFGVHSFGSVEMVGAACGHTPRAQRCLFLFVVVPSDKCTSGLNVAGVWARSR
jgi:hypothetical protein